MWLNIVITLLMLIALPFVLKRASGYLPMYGVKRKDIRSLSWPSQEIVRDYYDLPKENRPIPDIYRVLRALDTKYGVKKANSHFTRLVYHGSGGRSPVPSWDHGCRTYHKCILEEYVTLRKEIEAVAESVKEYNHQLALSGVDLKSINEFVSALRQEKSIVTGISNELKVGRLNS